MKKYLITLLITISLFVTTNCLAIVVHGVEKTILWSLEVDERDNWFSAINTVQTYKEGEPAENDGSITVNDAGVVMELNLRPEQNEAFIRGASAGIVAATPSHKFIQITRDIRDCS